LQNVAGEMTSAEGEVKPLRGQAYDGGILLA
jgi:hypothetical protein